MGVVTEWNAAARNTPRARKIGKPVQPALIPFANWLVKAMAAKRIKNNALALKLGVSTGAISEYRRALRRPRDPAQQMLADLFGDEVYRLLTPPISGLLIAAPALAGAGAVAATMTGAATPQSIIASVRAYLDSLEAQIISDNLTNEEAIRIESDLNQGTDG